MERLISDIESFISRNSIPVTRFGHLALGDKHFVKQLRNGRRVWPETEARVRSFMATYQSEQSQ